MSARGAFPGGAGGLRTLEEMSVMRAQHGAGHWDWQGGDWLTGMEATFRNRPRFLAWVAMRKGIAFSFFLAFFFF